MAQPTPYNRLYDFSDYQEVNPTKPLRGSEVDAELDAVKLTTDQLRANIGLIQRDDGKLANQSVTTESLSAGALAMIHQGEYRPRGAWASATAYALGDVVDFNAGTYLCLVEHTSVVQFANDLAANRWLLIANGALTGQSTAVDLFEGTGSQTVFTLGFTYTGSNAAQVFVGGVAQIPVQDFTISGTTLTFVVAPPAPSVAGRSNVMVRGAGVEAQLAANVATTQAANASASATAALGSETAAAGSETAAATSATAASNSATAAANSATTATNQATTSTTQATNAAGSATAAAGSASTATTQAANASASATAAAGSATTATNQATTATSQATAAAGSATAAATSATNAAASATSASGSASTATTQASNASGSATAAAGSATAAATSATNASGSAATAQLWAAKMDGPVAGGEFSAKYWAGEAASIVTAGVIDDTVTNTVKTWSSSKINTELGTKLSLTGGTVTGDTSFNGVNVGRGAGNVSTNTTVGTQALSANTTGTNNAAFGRQALRKVTTGGSNTAVGAESLVENLTGASNTAVGYGALYSSTASGNTGVGQQAGVAITTGADNTVVGNNALYNNATGDHNTALGSHALFNVTGAKNIGIGRFSASQITSGNNNVVIGGFSGIAGPLDIRTANNNVVLSDGDGNVRAVFNENGAMGLAGGNYGAEGQVPVSQGSGAAPVWAAKQDPLVSGTNIKTLGGTSLLGSGDVPLPSPAPEFVANGSIASAGLAVSLRSDGKVEVTTGQSFSATTGSSTTYSASALADGQTATYDAAQNKVVVFYREGSAGRAVVGTVSGTAISFGTPVTFQASGTTSNLGADYDAVNQKVVVVFKGAASSFSLRVGTVSGTTITFGSVTTQNDPVEQPSIAYDSASGIFIVTANNSAASDAGNIYLATVSGTSISVSYAAGVGNFTNYLKAVPIPSVGRVVFYWYDGGNSGRGAAIVGTISGSSISFGTKVLFTADAMNGQYRAGVCIPNTPTGAIFWNGRAIAFTVAGTAITFGAITNFATSASFVSATYHTGLQKLVVAYRDGVDTFGKYAPATVSSGSVVFESATSFSGSNIVTSVACAYSGANVVFAYANQSNGGLGAASVGQLPGVVTNANTFIGFSQSSAADGATLKVATEANVDANQTGLTANAKYYVNFDGTLTTTATAYPVAGTALSATRIQVATSPEFAPAATGAWILLQEVTASNSAEVDLTAFSSTYDDYVITFSKVQMSAVDWLSGRLRVNGTFQTGSSYFFAVHYRRSDDPNYRQEQSTSSNLFRLTSQASNSFGRDVCGIVRLFGVNAITTYKSALFEAQYYAHADNTFASSTGHGVWPNSAAALSGVRFLCLAGSNLTTGTFRLYGIKKS